MRSLLVLLFATACGTATSSPSADAALNDAGKQPFGAACTTGTECESGVCFTGGSRSFCTIHCTQASDCPGGVACNTMGYCRAP